MPSVPPTPSRRLRSREELADYLLDIGATLAAYGCPSYRLEDVIRRIAELEGYRAEPFALPTGLFLRVRPNEGDRVPDVYRMTRMSEWGVDLDRLTLVDEIFNDVVVRRSTIEQARARIRGVIAKPACWSPPLVWAATMACGGAVAVFFRGSAIDVLASAIVGVVLGATRFLLVTPAQRLLNDFFGGLFAAACAWICTHFWHDASAPIIVIAGAISLFPGMTFTTGLAELAQKNLVSGGARLMEAAITTLLVLFGVALLAGLGELSGEKIEFVRRSVEGRGLSLPYQAVALVVASLSFAVIFQVPRRFLWGALLSGATGYVVTSLATKHLPLHIAAFCAALAVCALANGLARATARPAQLFMLPGLMLLVPGSFGFRSLGALLSTGELAVLSGVSQGFAMVLIGIALVVGILVANVVLPPRKLL
ncbi:MAG: threonine/serine exporter family protein [Polyangiaceae bacterium]|nr:threonine/serine exporter family protein [Polyangiaceae bacterium]